TWPVVDLKLAARRLTVGSGFVAGSVSFDGRVQGRLDDLEFKLTIPRGQALTVLGETYELPRQATFVLTQGAAYLHVVMKGPRTAKLTASGRVWLTGHLGLTIDLNDLPLARLPGVADTGLGLGGEISGRLT